MQRILYLSLLLIWLPYIQFPVQSQQLDATPMVQLYPDRLEIEWLSPQPVWLQNEAGQLAPQMAGFDQLNKPGHYAVPVSSLMVALPAGANPDIEITAVHAHKEPLSHPLAVAQQPEGVLYNERGEAVGGDFVAAELVESPFAELITLEEVGTMRGVRLARVQFSPIQPADSSQIEFVTRLEVAIHFNAAVDVSLSKTGFDDPLLTLIQHQVVNPAQVQAGEMTSVARVSEQGGPQSVMIEVDTSGITAVTYDDLLSAGFSLNGVDPDKLQLYHHDTAVPLDWDGDGDSNFETDERILFFANPQFSRWSQTDSYELRVINNNGSRLSTTASSTSGLTAGDRTATLLLEENQIYTPNCYCGSLPFTRNGDRWIWDDLRQPGRPENQYPFDLSSVDTAKTAQLTIWMMGFTTNFNENPDHKVELSINNAPLGNVLWDGKTAVTDTLTIPASVLQMNNELSLMLPGLPNVTIDGIWFDAAQIQYSLGVDSVGNQVQFEGETTPHRYITKLNNVVNVRVYDVTSPEVPSRVTGFELSGKKVIFGHSSSGIKQYVISNENGLLSPTTVRAATALRTQNETSADYVIISHPDFISGLDRLIDWRQAQGLDVVVEDVTAIFDVYGHGRPAPEYIQAFLKDAYNNWSPTYVLLVGDATADPKNYVPGSSETWLLPYMDDADPWIGEIPSDNLYVSVDGDDIMPDMIVGRLPVNSLSETQTVVDKIIGYEESPRIGTWNGYAAFVADDRDSAGDFEDHSVELIDFHLPAPYIAREIYHKPPGTTTEQIASQIQNTWAGGNGLLIYNGHSSTHQWGAERYFHLDDVANLANGNLLPIVLQMTCLTGSFQRSDFETLDEALLRHANGGAVAVWGSTGLGVATGHGFLSSAFLDALLSDYADVGTATMAAKMNILLNSPTNDELVASYTLFGDPATVFNIDLTPGYNSFLPILPKES